MGTKDDEKLAEQQEQQVAKKPSKNLILRRTYMQGADTYAIDIYSGPVPPLSPGDTVIVDEKLPNGDTLYIVKKSLPGPAPPVPPAPLTANDIAVSTPQDKALSIDLTSNVIVPAGATATSVTIASPPSNGTAVVSGAESIMYTPKTGYNGIDSLSYSAADSVGATSNVAKITVTVGEVPVTPTPTPTPPGPTPTPTTAGVDQFGVKKLYPDLPGGPVTYMNMDDPTQTRGAGMGNNPEGNTAYYPKFVKNPDGSWKNTNGLEVRWAWCAEGNYPGDNNISKCYDTNNRTHNMGNSGDWPPSVEVTAYYKADSIGSGTRNGECHIEHVISGHRSTTSSSSSGPGGCQLGCAGSYHCNKYPKTGRKKFEKDYHHSFAYAQDISGVNNNTATPAWANDGKWHGFKDVFYIRADGASVQLEQWSDWNADGNWKKDHSFIDHGQWTPKAAYSGCGSGPQNIVFLFNGPLIVFRADNWESYSMKNLSIRSIDASKPLMAKEEHAREIPPSDFVEKDDTIYQEEKWREEEEDPELAEAKKHAEMIAEQAKSASVRKDAAEVSKEAGKALEK